MGASGTVRSVPASRTSSVQPTLAFSARGTVQNFGGEHPRENNVLVELYPVIFPGPCSGILSVRTVRKGKAGALKASSFVTKFNIRTCIHVSDREKLAQENMMVVLFSKEEGEMAKEKTKFSAVSLRGWTKASCRMVEKLWDRLHEAAQLQVLSPPGSSSAAVPAKDVISHLSSVSCRSSPQKSRNFVSNSNLNSVTNIEDCGISETADRSNRSSRGDTFVRPPKSSGVSSKQVLGHHEAASRREGKYTRMGSLLSGIIGPPPDCNAPLMPTKAQKMRTRSSNPNAFASPESRLVTGKRNSLEPLQSRIASRGTQSATKKPRVNQNREKSKLLSKSTSLASCDGEVDLNRSQTVNDRENKSLSSPCNNKLPASAPNDCGGYHSNPERSKTANGNPSLPSYYAPSENSSSPRGIMNLGNTCYLGSVLQLFMQDDKFMQDIVHRISPAFHAPFARALVDLYKAQDSAVIHRYPEMVRNAISMHFPEFGTELQQDAHEFLIRCFSVLEDEIGDNMVDSPLSRHFSLVVECSYECSSCEGRTTPRQELFHDLSLDIPVYQGKLRMEQRKDRFCNQENASNIGNCSNADDVGTRWCGKDSMEEVGAVPSLDELIENYFKVSKVDLTCERPNCHGTAAYKHAKILLRPRILVLHLKRFRAELTEFNSFSFSKVSDRVKIPATIDVARYQACPAFGPSVFDELMLQRDQAKSLGDSCERGSRICESAKTATVPGRVRVKLPRPATLQDCNGSKESMSQDHPELAGEAASRLNADQRDDDQSLRLCKENPNNVKVQRSANSHGCRHSSTVDSGKYDQNRSTHCGPEHRRFYKITAESEDESNPRGRHTSGESALQIYHTRQEVLNGETTDFIEEVEEYENTQASRPCNVLNQVKVRQLASSCLISEADASRVLSNANWNITRAVGLLLDEAHKTKICGPEQRIKSVSELARSLDGLKHASDCSRYRLSAIVRHLSSVAEYGHYVCDVRQSDGEWRCFNDSVAHPCGESPFELCDRQQDGYLFFYTLE